jgi:hypothetical protein
LSLNLKKLQSNARRRLGLKGSIEFKSVPRSQASSLRIGSEFLSTSTNALTLSHTIMYSDVTSLNPADIYHEFCKAKLNECGFTTIEAASLSAIRDSSKSDPKYIRDTNSAVVIVSEAYASSLLFSNFKEEARDSRESIVLRFESSDALTSLHTQMGFWGTAGLSYYKLASQWAGVIFPQKQIEQAIERASDGEEIKKEYQQINELLSSLPNIDLLQTERISDSDSIQIVDVITRLFSAKTGLEC